MQINLKGNAIKSRSSREVGSMRLEAGFWILEAWYWRLDGWSQWWGSVNCIRCFLMRLETALPGWLLNPLNGDFKNIVKNDGQQIPNCTFGADIGCGALPQTPVYFLSWHKKQTKKSQEKNKLSTLMSFAGPHFFPAIVLIRLVTDFGGWMLDVWSLILAAWFWILDTCIW